MSVEIVGDEIAIEDLVIEDPVAAAMLEVVSDQDDRAALLADMIEVGARIHQRQQDGQQGDLLRREIERLEEKIAHAQLDLIGRAGRDFADAVQRVMIEVSQQLSSIGGRLDGALAVATKDEELVAERQRGTAKGIVFEQAVADHVDVVARHQGDTCESVGLTGTISGRAGDVLVHIDGVGGASKGSIVFEAKAGKLSRPEAMRELDRALEARGADFAVLVVAGAEKVPATTFELREYGGNKIICSVDEASGTWGLECAYALARARVLLRRGDHEGADVEGAQKAIEQAVQQLDQVRQVKLRLTSIAGAAEETKGIIDTMSHTIISILDRASTALDASQKQ